MLPVIEDVTRKPRPKRRRPIPQVGPDAWQIARGLAQPEVAAPAARPPARKPLTEIAGALADPGPPPYAPAPGPGRSGGGPYDLAGDGGAWDPATGINLFNPRLARGDMPSPGKGWRMDDFGTPFWRTDYIDTPQGLKIKGEDSYSGDYPLVSLEELRRRGII